MKEDLPIEIRNGKVEDYGFILASWSNEVHHIKYDNFIPNSIFFPRQKTLINNILKQSIVKVANVEGETDLICGYIIVQPHGKSVYIHWANVKPIYRRQGICKSLFEDFLKDFNNPILVVTSPFMLLPEFKKKYDIIFDPSVVDYLRLS